MIHLFLNALAASAGAGLTYVRNVLPLLSCRPDVQTTAAISSELHNEFKNLNNISFLELKTGGAMRRFLCEQALLPALIKQSKAKVLISAGNFALRRCPVPQILLSGNSLYTSTDFSHDLLARREYRMWLDNQTRAFLAKQS